MGDKKHESLKAGREIGAILRMASPVTGERNSAAAILRRVESESVNVVLFRPKVRSAPSVTRWFAAVPIAASLAFGIYVGATGTFDGYLPSSLTGDVVAVGEDPGDLSGVSDAEALAGEGIS